MAKLLRRLLPLHDKLKPDRQPSVKFVLTTRGYPKISDLFWDCDMSCVHLSVDSRKEKDQIQNEIKLVIDHRLRALAKKRHLSEKRELAIREALEDVDAEQPTYLWVGLVFQVLEKNFDDRSQAWRSLIKETPSTVFHAYEKLLQYVQSRDLPHVRALFHLILAAYRALTAINTSESSAMAFCWAGGLGKPLAAKMRAKMARNGWQIGSTVSWLLVVRPKSKQ